MAPSTRHDHQRLYWKAAAQQAQENLTRSNGGQAERITLLHTLRSWRRILGCDCCAVCGAIHTRTSPHHEDTPPTCSHGIPKDPPC